MTVVDTNQKSDSNNKSSSSVLEKVKATEEGLQALAVAVAEPIDGDDDDDDDESTATTDLRKLINAEVTPPKSLVVIWILMAVELGFDLITTGIAFVSTLGTDKCCGHTVYMGPLPMTTSIPFFFLIVAEITFLIRAILLTLWPSVFEASRVAAHGTDDTTDNYYGDDDDVDDQVGFEVALAKSESADDDKDNSVRVVDVDDNDSKHDLDGEKLDGKALDAGELDGKHGD